MEQNFPGHGGAGKGSGKGAPAAFVDDLEYGPGGLAVAHAADTNRAAPRSGGGASGPKGGANWPAVTPPRGATFSKNPATGPPPV